MAGVVGELGLVCDADEILAKRAALYVLTVFLSSGLVCRQGKSACVSEQCPSCWYLIQ